MIVRATALALLLAGSTGAQRVNPRAAESLRGMADDSLAHDSVALLSVLRLEKLPPAMQRDWYAYIGRSTAEYAHDTAVAHREIRSAHLHAPRPAPYAPEFSVAPYMTPAWFATDTARRMADAIASYQAPDGGWSKHVDFTRHSRLPGESLSGDSNEWTSISTIVDAQTTEEIDFLNLASHAHANAKYDRAIARGIDYLLDAQYPNGCYPRAYPLEGGDYDAVALQGDATVNVLRLLDSVASGGYPAVTDRTRSRAAAAAARGVTCMLNAQVRVAGELAGWGEQHDPLTLAPTTTLSAPATVAIVDYLMSLSDPSARVVTAVHAAVRWLRQEPISESGASASAWAALLARFDRWSSDHPPLP